jgi:hypothetical protein
MPDLATLAAVTLSEVSPMMRGEVWAPVAPVALVQNVAQNVYDKALVGRNYSLQFCRLQNLGTKTILVCLNDVATSLKYNYVLAAGVATDDGNGGVVEIPGTWNIGNISVITTDAAGSKLGVTLIVTPLVTRVENF